MIENTKIKNKHKFKSEQKKKEKDHPIYWSLFKTGKSRNFRSENKNLGNNDSKWKHNEIKEKEKRSQAVVLSAIFQ